MSATPPRSPPSKHFDEASKAAEDPDVHLTEGKTVREFAVIRTDKGRALDLMRHNTKCHSCGLFR